MNYMIYTSGERDTITSDVSQNDSGAKLTSSATHIKLTNVYKSISKEKAPERQTQSKGAALDSSSEEIANIVDDIIESVENNISKVDDPETYEATDYTDTCEHTNSAERVARNIIDDLMNTLESNEAKCLIPQYDGDIDSDFSESDNDDDETLYQSDGNFDAEKRLSRFDFVKLSYATLNYKYQSVRVVTQTQTSGNPLPSSNGSKPAQAISTGSQQHHAGHQSPSPIKRDRSASEESSDGGEQPNKKKYQCHICNKLFPNSFRLKTHVRVHTGEKPYKCEPCQQAFADRYILCCTSYMVIPKILCFRAIPYLTHVDGHQKIELSQILVRCK